MIGTAIDVRTLARDDARLDPFLLRHERSLPTHCSRYASMLCELLHAEVATLAAFEGEELRGVMPLLRRESAHGFVYNSMPYFGSPGGPIADSEEIAAAIVDAYNALVTAPDALGGTVIANALLGGSIPNVAYNHGDYRISQITELDGGDVMTRIDPSARRNVQKAERANIEVGTDAAAIERLYELHVENMTAIGGLPKQRELFDLVPRHFAHGSEYAIWTARKDDHVVAALLLFYFNRTVEYYVPAIEEAYRSDQPLSLICVAAMREAAARGFRWWNWGGTWPSQTGVYRFKRKWATLEQRYEYYVQMNRPELLQWPAKRFVDAFAGFYVVPFSALAGVEE